MKVNQAYISSQSNTFAYACEESSSPTLRCIYVNYLHKMERRPLRWWSPALLSEYESESLGNNFLSMLNSTKQVPKSAILRRAEAQFDTHRPLTHTKPEVSGKYTVIKLSFMLSLPAPLRSAIKRK